MNQHNIAKRLLKPKPIIELKADEFMSSQTIAKPNVICCYYFIVKLDDEIIEHRMSQDELYIKSEISALKNIYSKYKNCHFWYGVSCPEIG